MAKNSAHKKKQTKVVHSPENADLEHNHDMDEHTEEKPARNLSRGERVVSGVMGSGMLLYGVTNFLSIRGQLSNVAGAYMLARGVTGHCAIYERLGIDSSPKGRIHHLGFTDPHPIQFRQSILTHRSPAEVFEFFRDQTQIARCFPQVKQLQKVNSHRSTWIFSDPSGLTQVPVPVEITQETEPQRIAWTAFPDSKLRVTGSLDFKHGPHNQGTEITATVHVIPPAGLMGAKLMKWLSPVNNAAITAILDKVKILLETGEVAPGQEHVILGLMDQAQAWPTQLKSKIQLRTMQTLASRHP